MNDWPAGRRSDGTVGRACACFLLLLALGTAVAEEATYVGTAMCEGCHRLTADLWQHTVHAAVFTETAEDELARRGCEACHGPGSQHTTNPTQPGLIVGFADRSATPIKEQNDTCMTCHRGGQRLHWEGSVHESADVACSDCHNPMARFSADGLLAEESINETCFGCHRTQRSEFEKRSHMPLLEGKLTCLDCHGPHGTTTDPLLVADSVNETCYQCHAEKRGPFIWEHAPVREDCLNCHRPHGSNHEKLLLTARPVLCQQCHSSIGHVNDLMSRGNLAGGERPDPRAIGRSCSNCHAQIHGSNHPAGARLHR